MILGSSTEAPEISQRGTYAVNLMVGNRLQKLACLTFRVSIESRLWSSLRRAPSRVVLKWLWYRFQYCDSDYTTRPCMNSAHVANTNLVGQLLASWVKCGRSKACCGQWHPSLGKFCRLAPAREPVWRGNSRSSRILVPDSYKTAGVIPSSYCIRVPLTTKPSWPKSRIF